MPAFAALVALAERNAREMRSVYCHWPVIVGESVIHGLDTFSACGHDQLVARLWLVTAG